MKKYLPYLLIPVFLSLVLIIILDQKKSIETKVLTVNTNYTYLYNKNKLLTLNIYLNNANHPLTNIDAYESVYLTNKRKDKQLEINLKDITYSHEESYLKEVYILYNLMFEMPNLSSDFIINDSYLLITLTNNNSYTFKLGNFSLMYLEGAKELNWQTIDSMKDIDNNLSISKILVKTTNHIDNIELVYVNYLTELSFSYINELLVVTILSDNNYYLNNMPLIIETLDETYYLNNYQYTTDYNLIEKASGIINIYDLD